MNWIVVFPPIKPPFIEKERKKKLLSRIDSLGPHGQSMEFSRPEYWSG